MPARQYAAANSYRYGFNGKEKDNEISGQGNQYDYGFRIYNPRIGKFLSVDPLTGSYPWYTPYQFAGNTPIQAIDLDGLEEVYPRQAQKVPVLQRPDYLVSESTCIGCATRAQGIHHIQQQDALTKLLEEYVSWTIEPGNIGKPVPSKFVKVAHKATGQNLNQGGYLGSDEFKITKARYDTYGKYLPGISDIEDGANMIKNLSDGNYKMAAMFALFLLPGGDYAKPAKDFITRLGADGIEFALKNTSRLQHAFKHAKDIKQFAGKNWNKQVGEAWKNFNADILNTATKSFDNVLGSDKVKGFFKNVDGQNIATYVYKEGDNAGQIATTVVLNENQMVKFGLK
ncbi:MAG: hypothetical protein H6627_14960 [Calditrichae bacterium]|nr:hypothetical protein [Calditrichia bacterium]